MADGLGSIEFTCLAETLHAYMSEIFKQIGKCPGEAPDPICSHWNAYGLTCEKYLHGTKSLVVGESIPTTLILNKIKNYLFQNLVIYEQPQSCQRSYSGPSCHNSHTLRHNRNAKMKYAHTHQNKRLGPSLRTKETRGVPDIRQPG